MKKNGRKVFRRKISYMLAVAIVVCAVCVATVIMHTRHGAEDSGELPILTEEQEVQAQSGVSENEAGDYRENSGDKSYTGDRDAAVELEEESQAKAINKKVVSEDYISEIMSDDTKADSKDTSNEDFYSDNNSGSGVKESASPDRYSNKNNNNSKVYSSDNIHGDDSKGNNNDAGTSEKGEENQDNKNQDNKNDSSNMNPEELDNAGGEYELPIVPVG